jgi:hypothetical protein
MFRLFTKAPFGAFLGVRSFSSKSSQSEKPWRIVGAAVLQKNPEIVWGNASFFFSFFSRCFTVDHEPWMSKYEAFILRKQNSTARL